MKYLCLPDHSRYGRIKESCERESEGVVSVFVLQLPEVGHPPVMAIDGKTAGGTITQQEPIGVHVLAA